MDSVFGTCDSEETRASCWIRQTLYAVLAGTALLALLVAFAVAIVDGAPTGSHPERLLLKESISHGDHRHVKVPQVNGGDTLKRDVSADRGPA